jgi:hypothetical protein
MSRSLGCMLRGWLRENGLDDRSVGTRFENAEMKVDALEVAGKVWESLLERVGYSFGIWV